MTAVVIFSGGLDSTTALYEAVNVHSASKVEAVSFHYGQRHQREIYAAEQIAKYNLIQHHIVDLCGYPITGKTPHEFMKAGALTGDEVVPYGHYEAPSMKATVVPNRNMIFISIAAARLMQLGGGELYLGIHAGDHAIYPDCRAQFFTPMFETLQVVSDGAVILRAPFLGWRKDQIVRRGSNLRVPFKRTWSCYEGGEVHCGKCGTCVERKEAFVQAGVNDPTVYAP